MKHRKLEVIGYCIIGVSCKIEKGPEVITSPPKCSEDFRKIISLLKSNQLAKFGGLMSCGSKHRFRKRTLFHELILIMTSQIW